MTGVSALSFAVVVLLFIAALLSWPLTWLLLHRYRAHVVRVMGRTSMRAMRATRDPDPSPQADVRGARRRRQPLSGPDRYTTPSHQESDTVSAAVDRAARRRRTVWLRYALAGGAQAAVLTVAALASAQLGFGPWRIAVLWFVYAWPLVITAAILAGFDRRLVVRAAVTYVAVLLVLGAAGGSVFGGVVAWALAGSPATVVVVAYLHRSVRAVGVIVVLFVFVGLIGAGLFVAFVGVSDERLAVAVTVAAQLDAGAVAAVTGMLVIGFAAAAVAGWFALARFGQAYRNGLPDQLLLIGAVWAVFAAAQGLPLASGSAVWAPTALVAFAAFWLIAARPLDSGSDADAPRLLILRVFALGRLSEDLFRRVTTEWQYVGPMRLIGGPDLARTTVEPDEFLTFAAGRLDELFVTAPEQVELRRDGTATRDRHGRYRVQEFLCFDDTWQPVVRMLMRETDVVLMDIRGFAAGNDGTRHELTMLARLGMLRRALLVVDGQTDRALVTAAVAAGGGDLSLATVVRLDERRRLSAADLLGALPPPRGATGGVEAPRGRWERS